MLKIFFKSQISSSSSSPSSSASATASSLDSSFLGSSSGDFFGSCSSMSSVLGLTGESTISSLDPPSDAGSIPSGHPPNSSSWHFSQTGHSSFGSALLVQMTTA